MSKLERYGFVVDKCKSELNLMFQNKNINEVHMDVYMNDPYMLLSRVKESKVKSSFENGGIVLRRKDKTVIMNLVFDSIEECVVKQYAPSHYQIVFKVHNVSYRLLIIL